MNSRHIRTSSLPPAVFLTPAPAMAAGGDTGQAVSLTLALVKAVGALALIIGLMLLIAFWLRRLGVNRRGGPTGTALITIVDSRMVAPKKQVAVLEVAGQFVLVGISEQQINLLSRLDDCPALREHGRSAAAPADFASLLGRCLGRHKKPAAAENRPDEPQEG